MSKTVVIVGSGLATRLYPMTNVIPKMLVNVGHDTALKLIIDEYYRHDFKHFVITVASEEHRNMVFGYIKNFIEYSRELKIDIEVVEEAKGSLWAIAKSSKHFERSTDIIFNWSDVIPKFGTIISKATMIYTTQNSNCRYIMELNRVADINHGYVRKPYNPTGHLGAEQEVKLAPPLFPGIKVPAVKNVLDNSGDIVGIYQTHGTPFTHGMEEHVLKWIDSTNREVDFIEYFEYTQVYYDNGKSKKCMLASKIPYMNDFDPFTFGASEIRTIDAGDYFKLGRIKESTFGRSFNEVLIKDNVVIKKASNRRAKELQLDELEWYNKVDVNLGLTPEIYSIDSKNSMFIMERVEPGINDYFAKGVLSSVHAIDKLHKSFKINLLQVADLDDVGVEVLKMTPRTSEIGYAIEAFEKSHETKGEFIVNGVNVGFGSRKGIPNLAGRVLSIIKEIMMRNKRWHMNKTGFIHGDTNKSNIVVTGKRVKGYYNDLGLLETKLIDPRGYFGNTKFKGPLLYDYIKLIYGYSGYDEFNSSVAPRHMKVMYSSNNSVEVKTMMDDQSNEVIELIKPMLMAKGDMEFEPFEIATNRHYSESLEWTEFEHKDFEVLVNLWLGVVWINLSGYFSNNPYKAIAAYYHGLSIILKTLEEKD